MEKYKEEEIESLISFANNLSEKARRHFLALQYRQLGKGSQRYIAKIFGCSRITITKGLRELEKGGEEVFNYTRQRKAGGGRKKKKSKKLVWSNEY